MTIYPQLVNISPEIILILKNMLIYALFIDCRESHLRTFCRKIHQCARIGGRGGLSQSWQCQDFGSACYSNPSLSLSPLQDLLNTNESTWMDGWIDVLHRFNYLHHCSTYS